MREIYQCCIGNGSYHFRFPFKRKHFSPFLLFVTDILGFVKVLIKSLTGVVRNTEAVHSEAVVRRYSVKKLFLKISQNSQENTCAKSLFFNKVQACNFIKKETLVQMFSFKCCQTSKNTFFIEYLRWLRLYISKSG